jgi:hypothetical protein
MPFLNQCSVTPCHRIVIALCTKPLPSKEVPAHRTVYSFCCVELVTDAYQRDQNGDITESDEFMYVEGIVLKF